MTDHHPDRVDSGFSRKNNSDLSLDELARRVRTADEGIALAAVNIVDLALTAGDALIQAKDKVEYGGWLDHLKYGCGISEDKAERYMRIARGRAVLEADSARVRNLSLTAALRLIQEKSGTPRGGARRRSVGKKTNTANSLDALGWWGGASPKQRRHFLEGVGLRSLRDAEPPIWSTRVSEDLDHLALSQLVDLPAHRLQLAGIDDACMDLRRIRERIERVRPSLDLEATPVAGSA